MAYTSATFSWPVGGTRLATRAWGHDIATRRGIVQLAHVLAEHLVSCDRVAGALVGHNRGGGVGERLRARRHIVPRPVTSSAA